MAEYTEVVWGARKGMEPYDEEFSEGFTCLFMKSNDGPYTVASYRPIGVQQVPV